MARALRPSPEAKEALARLLEPEFMRPVPRPVTQFAERLAARAGGAAAAVLFYGSALRDEALDGLLDFYVLLDRAAAWPGSRLAALANRILPPNVGYEEQEIDGRILRAKYAVMTLTAFRRRNLERALDTTLWTRFSQPAACVYARSEQDFAAVLDAVCHATLSAAYWAAVLGPERGAAGAYWSALYAQTYQLELRVESTERSGSLVERDRSRYAQALPVAWRALGIEFEEEAGKLRPLHDPRARSAALRAWRFRRRLGKPLNLLRLTKAAFTFDGAMDYVVWKVERHSGVRLAVAPWQRRFPLLAAPGLYCRLRRRGLLR